MGKIGLSYLLNQVSEVKFVGKNDDIYLVPCMFLITVLEYTNRDYTLTFVGSNDKIWR